MERFIDVCYKTCPAQMSFKIQYGEIYRNDNRISMPITIDLKSSMERFIARLTLHLYAILSKFKIQYGEIYSFY